MNLQMLQHSNVKCKIWKLILCNKMMYVRILVISIAVLIPCCSCEFIKSKLTEVSREAKEEVPYDSLSTNGCQYFTRTNLVKLKMP